MVKQFIKYLPSSIHNPDPVQSIQSTYSFWVRCGATSICDGIFTQVGVREMLQILERLRGLTFSANTKERQMTNYTKLRFWNSFLSFEIRGAWSSNSSLKISSQVEIVGFEKCRGHFETADRAKMVCAGGNRKGSCFVSAFICILHNHL